MSSTEKLEMSQQALKAFHQPPEDYNCAQAVLAAYQYCTGNTVSPLSEFKRFGGGRAPENECGALHAACLCHPVSAAKLRAQFQEALGARACHELKRKLKVPCIHCVQTAAALLQAACN